MGHCLSTPGDPKIVVRSLRAVQVGHPLDDNRLRRACTFLVSIRIRNRMNFPLEVKDLSIKLAVICPEDDVHLGDGRVAGAGGDESSKSYFVRPRSTAIVTVPVRCTEIIFEAAQMSLDRKSFRRAYFRVRGGFTINFGIEKIFDGVIRGCSLDDARKEEDG